MAGYVFDNNDTRVSPDSKAADAFGRFRVSESTVICNNSFTQNDQAGAFSSTLVSGGTITRNANTVSMDLAVTSASGSSVIYQTKRRQRYNPGQSFLTLITGKFEVAKTNLRQRLGYFDEANGVFFEMNGTDISVVRRSSVSGSVVDTKIEKANWNMDKLDGEGESEAILDMTKQQIFVIDFQWLGSGRIRFGFNIDGVTVYVHEITNANLLDVPYSQSGRLPNRFEITNTGATSGASTLRITCLSTISEGQVAAPSVQRSVNRGISSVNISGIGTFNPIISLRLKSANSKAEIIPRSFSAFNRNNDPILVELVVNPTLTGASWTSVSDDSIAEVDTSATAVSGGEVIESFYVSAQARDKQINLNRDILGLYSDIDGVSDIITVRATEITAGAQVYGTITFDEVT